jgi:methylated-DNA-[protein]-cysteine S-methyltransferase
MPQLSMHSPIGDLTVAEEDGAIVALDWGWVSNEWQEETPLLKETIRQLNAYFDGELTQFSLPLNPEGTTFQQGVWKQMCLIPTGQTRTYGELSNELKSSAQAVGNACGANPIPVIIPCHRILAANGLGGFSGAGGIETKTALLKLEKALPDDNQYTLI